MQTNIGELARWLRDDALIVEEQAGWQTNGTGDVWVEVVVSHHTAGGPNGRAPSLGTINGGVPGVRPPLANILQTRESSGDDHFIVIAAGRSNNAGDGSWAGFSGNSRTCGLEIEHTGVEVLPERRARLACRAQAAILRGLGLGADRHCQHWEWNGQGGKIDVAEADPGAGPGGRSVDGDLWRRWTAEYLAGGAPPPPSIFTEDETMARHATFKEAVTSDLCAIVPGDDGLLWFWRKRGSVWGRRQPVVFASGGAQVRCNPNGGVTVNRIGDAAVEAVVEGAAEPNKKPTLVSCTAPPPGHNFDAWWAVTIPS